MPSYVRPGIRKCAKNRALSNLLGRYFAKVMSFSLTRQRTKRLASALNCENYPKSQLSRGYIRYRRGLGSSLGRATWGTTLIPMHITDSFFL